MFSATQIKFGAFLDFINNMDFDYVASGHYAHVKHPSVECETKCYVLHLSADQVWWWYVYVKLLEDRLFEFLFLMLNCEKRAGAGEFFSFSNAYTNNLHSCLK
jgi:tRNA U34 2-thiouridine synthase MnmA/TrmU